MPWVVSREVQQRGVLYQKQFERSAVEDLTDLKVLPYLLSRRLGQTENVEATDKELLALVHVDVEENQAVFVVKLVSGTEVKLM